MKSSINTKVFTILLAGAWMPVPNLIVLKTKTNVNLMMAQEKGKARHDNPSSSFFCFFFKGGIINDQNVPKMLASIPNIFQIILMTDSDYIRRQTVRSSNNRQCEVRSPPMPSGPDWNGPGHKWFDWSWHNHISYVESRLFSCNCAGNARQILQMWFHHNQKAKYLHLWLNILWSLLGLVTLTFFLCRNKTADTSPCCSLPLLFDSATIKQTHLPVCLL